MMSDILAPQHLQDSPVEASSKAVIAQDGRFELPFLAAWQRLYLHGYAHHVL